jgi:predicted nucleic acid-binding protein
VILVDTGYLIALLDRRDQLHTRARAWAKAMRDQALVSEYVLCEAVNHFSSIPSNRAKIHQLLDSMLTHPRTTVVYASKELFEIGLGLHRRRPDQSWSLTDCISFHVMRDRGIVQALAHDIHFTQAGFDALLRRDP